MQIKKFGVNRDGLSLLVAPSENFFDSELLQTIMRVGRLDGKVFKFFKQIAKQFAEEDENTVIVDYNSEHGEYF